MTMLSLPGITVIAVIVVLALFLFLIRRRPSDIPTVPPRKRGRVNDSVWLFQAEFDAFTKENDLVPPRNSALYSVWVRSGTFVVVAVSMKSGDRIAVSKVSML